MRLWIVEDFITFDDADLGIVKGTAIGGYRPAFDWEWYVEFRYSFSVYTRDGGAKLDVQGVRRIGEYPPAGLETDILADGRRLQSVQILYDMRDLNDVSAPC